MNAKTNAERQRDYYKNMKKAGMEKVSVYVPTNRIQDLRDFAAKLREEEK